MRLMLRLGYTGTRQCLRVPFVDLTDMAHEDQDGGWEGGRTGGWVGNL